MKFGGAKRFVLAGCEGEKLRVRLVSNTLSTLQNDFKVKIDDIRKRIPKDAEKPVDGRRKSLVDKEE